jgi:hypothetical protein
MDKYRCNDGGEQPTQHRPTAKSKAMVEGFILAGFTQSQIASYLDIAINTLKKHYSKELSETYMNKTMALSNAVYRDALKGDKQQREFWLRTRGKWANAKPAEEKERDEKILTLLEQLAQKL